MRRMFILAAPLALMACDGSAENTPTPQPPAPETGAAAQVRQLDEDQRNTVLQKAIRASGAGCPAIVTSEHMEVRKGAMGWRASCNDRTAHLIEIQPDGTAQVTSRRD